jgi:hypothetical protein
VRDLAQVLHRVALRLHRVRVGIVDPADDLDALAADLDGLALALRGDELAGRADRASGRDAQDVALVVGELLRCDHLERLEAAAVVDREERQASLRVAPRADPAFDGDLRPDRDLS